MWDGQRKRKREKGRQRESERAKREIHQGLMSMTSRRIGCSEVCRPARTHREGCGVAGRDGGQGRCVANQHLILKPPKRDNSRITISTEEAKHPQEYKLV